MLTIFKNIFTKLKGLFANLQKPVSQVIEPNEVLKKEHQVICDVFFERMKAYRDWNKLEELYPGQKGVFVFMLNEQESIFKDVNPKDVNSLSEENFRQLLLSTFKKIRKQHLANYEVNQILAKKENLTGDEVKQILAKKGNVTGDAIKQILAKKGNVTGDEVSQILAKKENLTGDEISQIVAKRVVDAQWTENKDKAIKFAGGLFGIDIDPKDRLGSIKRGILNKFPFVGDGKEEEDNQPSLRGTQVVTKFLRQSLLPIVLFSFSLLIFGSGPIVLTISGIGLLITEVKAVKSLFSNDNNANKKDENILFFSSHDTEIWEKTIEHKAKLEQDENEKNIEKWTGVIGEDISEILQEQQINTTQVTDPQAAQAKQKGAGQEESMSQTNWADTVRTGDQVSTGHKNR